MVSAVVISPDDWEGLVLAEVMEAAKEIRPGDKKRVKTGVKTPINRRPGWGPGGCLPFWGPEMQGGRGRRRGWWCWRWRPGRRGDGLPVVACWAAFLAAACGLPGMAGAGNDPAAIWRDLISH